MTLVLHVSEKDQIDIFTLSGSRSGFYVSFNLESCGYNEGI